MDGVTNFPLFCACMLATRFLELAVHEGGHWAAGRLVGIPIREVRVGGGQPVASVLAGATSIVVGWVPSSGHVVPYPGLLTSTWREVVLCAGGSAASVLLIGVLAASLWILPDGGEIVRTLLVAALINALWGAGQVLPYIPMSSGVTRDYHLIRDAIRGRGDDDETWARHMYRACVTSRYGAQGDGGPSRDAPLVIHAIVSGPPSVASGTTMPAGERRPAVESFQRWLLTRPSLSTPERAALLDGLATAALLGEIRAPTADLDAWSAELLALVPEIPTARATRGAVLVAIGRAGGRALLERDPVDGASPFDRALRRVFIARALLDESDRDGSAAMLAEADLASAGLEAEFPVLKDLRAELAAAPSPGDGPTDGRR